MARKKNSEPQRPVRALYPPTNIKQDARYLVARASVLGTVELLEGIFSHVSQGDLILNVRGVCRLWKDIVPRMPETYLNKVPPQESHHAAPQFNPLLFQHFRAMFGVTQHQSKGGLHKATLDICDRCRYGPYTWTKPSNYYLIGCVAGCEKHLHGMSISIVASAIAEHRKFTRPNASWRKMQLASPPITKLRYTGLYGEEKMVMVAEGLRMGALYDLVVYGGLGEVKETEHPCVEIAWASRQPQRRQRMDDDEPYLGRPSGESSNIAVDEIRIARITRFSRAEVRLQSLAHVARRKLLCSGIQERKLIVQP